MSPCPMSFGYSAPPERRHDTKSHVCVKTIAPVIAGASPAMTVQGGSVEAECLFRCLDHAHVADGAVAEHAHGFLIGR
jgi:hypothetical protein